MCLYLEIFWQFVTKTFFIYFYKPQFFRSAGNVIQQIKKVSPYKRSLLLRIPSWITILGYRVQVLDFFNSFQHFGKKNSKHSFFINTLFVTSPYIYYSPQINSLVMSELSVGHVSVISDDFSDVRRWHVFLLNVDETKFPFLCVSLRLKLLPFSCYKQGKFYQ